MRTRQRSALWGWACLLCTLTFTSHAANLLENGGFDDNAFPWEAPGWWAGGSGTSGVDTRGRFCTTVETVGSAEWGAQLRQSGLDFVSGETYNVSLDAWSSTPVNLEISAVDESDGFVWIFGDRIDISAPPAGDPQTIEMSFTAAADSQVAFFRILMGGGAVPAGETVCFDNIVVEAPAVNLLENTDFENGALLPPGEIGFFAGSSGSAAVDAQGRYCIDVDNPGTAGWNVQYRETGLAFVNGRTYEFSADIWSSRPIAPEISAADESDGFVWIFGSTYTIDAPLDGPPRQLSASFTAAADTETGNFRFLLGSGHVPADTTVCLDNLALLDPEGEAEEELPPPPPVHVNQVGYLPAQIKQATYALPEGADASTPRMWTLMQNEAVVTSGTTIPHGPDIDSASGDVVHTIDFTSVMTEGTDYTLVVDESDESFTSQPFAIGDSVYEAMKYDALAYFYHNRSGTPILAEVVGEDWARPAGHLDDASVQTIECLNGEEGCRTLDAAGGWYDAGDHGKYVVNGGISVWTLLNQHERNKYLGAGAGEFGDGTMALPMDETTNGVSDLLDEARWEIEWFFKMQVPDDQNPAGMVHHKMHDENWTGLPTAPHEDTQTRYVHPPSTAATLNFAAVGAQCFRVYENIDADFADECLARAIIAYDAAKTNPVMLASNAGNGGGAYGDGNVDDEFYWAAAELYLATGQQRFADDMAASDLHLTVPADDISLMTWQRTNALGMLSLATAGEWFSADEDWVGQARAAILDAADNYVDSVHSEGYAVPMSPAAYPWGSNSFVANNLLVLGLAHDFTCDSGYTNAMTRGIDYLFGRNPLGHSYVTGYGDRVEQQPHHRFWANALNPDYPTPPPGVMSGGPNSSLEDPIAGALLAGCSPQRCFVDHIEAWSVNEITINWNSPFSWITAYMDEIGDPLLNQAAAQRCELRNHHFSSFEDPSRPWQSDRFGHYKRHKHNRIDVVAGGTDGEHALSVKACGLTRIESPEFETGEFEIVGDRLSVDVKFPEDKHRRFPWFWWFDRHQHDRWVGDIVITATLGEDEHRGWHRKRFHHDNKLFVGRERVRSSDTGDWTTLEFGISERVSDAFLEDQPAELEITLLTRECKDNILIDNIRFGGAILSR